MLHKFDCLTFETKNKNVTMRITPKAIKFYHDDLEDFIQLYQEHYGKTFVTFWQDNGTIFIKQFDNLDDACLWCINESDKHIRAKK